MAASVVPSSAIDSVSPIAERYDGSAVPGFGGSINATIQPNCARPLIVLVSEKSRYHKPKANNARAAAATT